ncbi:unnamed protein product, partial [Cyprideis torosa]
MSQLTEELGFASLVDLQGDLCRRDVDLFISFEAVSERRCFNQIFFSFSVERNVIDSIRIECNSQDMIMKISTQSLFNGLIYPKGLSRNTTCMSEYGLQEGPIDYAIPLWNCNTMSTTLPDGSVEYFNTIVVQPHRKLVTSQGRGYHIRCKYQTQEKLVRTDLNISDPISRIDSMLGTTPITATAAMPAVNMRIFYGDVSEQTVAENVRIGDPLTMEIALDSQEIYGFLVTDCYVRDGIGQSEQPLIDSDGCPVDEEIMGPLTYAPNKRIASVGFQAHKFPYTPSVYYQCTVKLCINSAGGCDDVPPNCNPFQRTKRQALIRRDENEEIIQDDERNIQVFTGLYVSEDPDFEDDADDILDFSQPSRQSNLFRDSRTVDEAFARIASPNEESLCHSYDRSRCDEYNECNETVITCGSTPTGISNYCFAAWENSTGVPTVMLKGCWNNEHQCSSRSECIANEEERHHQVFFCCCDEDYCNADFKFVPEPPSVDYDNESCADASCGDPSNDLPVWLIPVATLPVLILLMIVFYIVFTYRQKRKRRADQAESDATSPLTDPLNIPADSTVSQAPIHLLEQKSIGRFPVWKAEQGNNFVAVKLFSAQDESTWFHEQEVYRLPHISHPSILKFIHADRCGALDAPFRLVLEFHPHGSLYDFLKANVLSPAAICRLGESMARGLGHLHEEIPGRKYSHLSWKVPQKYIDPVFQGPTDRARRTSVLADRGRGRGESAVDERERAGATATTAKRRTPIPLRLSSLKYEKRRK